MPRGGATTASHSTRGYERTNGWLGRSSAASHGRSQITAPVADWERWTGMWFPEAGRYVFAGWARPARGVGRHRNILRAQRLDDPRRLTVAGAW